MRRIQQPSTKLRNQEKRAIANDVTCTSLGVAVSVKVSSQKSRVEKLVQCLKSFWAWQTKFGKVSIGLLEATVTSSTKGEEQISSLRLDETGRQLVKHARLLLATAGGRTSDTAAVPDDAGPDRSVPGTDLIDRWWSGRQRSLLTASWSKERGRKSES